MREKQTIQESVTWIKYPGFNQFSFLKQTIFVHLNISSRFQNLSSHYLHVEQFNFSTRTTFEAYLCRYSFGHVTRQQNKHGSRSNESILFQSGEEAECRPLVIPI